MAQNISKQTESWAPVAVAVTAVTVMLLSMSSVILLCLAMLPTLVATIVDRTPQKYAAFCVGSMNLSGTVPFLIDLWFGEHTIDQALGILGNVFSLAVIYGAAAFGWMIYTLVPPIIAAFLIMMARRRAQQLRTVQAQLVEEWGDILKRNSGGNAASAAEAQSTP